MWFCTYTLSKCFYNKDNKLQMQRIVGIYKCLEKFIYVYRKGFNWYRQLRKVYQYKNWKYSENTVIYFYFYFVGVHVFYSAPKPYSGLRTILFHPTSTDHRFAVLFDQGMDVWLLPQNQDQVRGYRITPHVLVADYMYLSNLY